MTEDNLHKGLIVRIKIESDIFTKEVFDNETGQSFNLSHTSKKESRYFTIRKLNAKVCIMDIGIAQARICKSSKDIEVFWVLMDRLDKYNELRITVSTLAEDLRIARSKITSMIARSVEYNLLKRVDRGVYRANPFMIRSKGSTNEIIEELQREWNELKKEN